MSFEVDGIEFSEDEFPQRFHDLIPLMRKWCIGDDALRCEFQSSVSKEELMEFLNRVEPRLDEIDDFLATLGKSLPEPLHLLALLSECTIEAQMELGLREATEEFPE